MADDNSLGDVTGLGADGGGRRTNRRGWRRQVAGRAVGGGGRRWGGWWRGEEVEKPVARVAGEGRRGRDSRFVEGEEGAVLARRRWRGAQASARVGSDDVWFLAARRRNGWADCGRRCARREGVCRFWENGEAANKLGFLGVVLGGDGAGLWGCF
ncbi:unnamed protein product [Linum trigynum]|uniref:Uncharacterized protein n=1 Tax=Linum trigynum TaxID=586398 RepID=A0AAV2FE85_9ROSI